MSDARELDAVAAHELVDWLAEVCDRTAPARENAVVPISSKAGPNGFEVEVLYKGFGFTFSITRKSLRP